MMVVRKGYVLGKFAVPLEEVEVEFDAPAEGSLVNKRTLMELDLFTRDASLEWLEVALRIRAKSFRGTLWPLFAEIQQAIQEYRAPQGARSSRRPNSGLSAVVRGRTLNFRNNMRGVKLLIPKDEVEEVLNWFLEQLESDKDSSDNLQKLSEPWRTNNLKTKGPSAKAPPATRARRAAQPEDTSGTSAGSTSVEDKVRDKILKELLEHPQVQRAFYAESRESWRIFVAGADGQERKVDCFVSGLKRRRLSENSEALAEHLFEEVYRRAVAKALAKAGITSGSSGGDAGGSDSEGSEGAEDAVASPAGSL